jgi:vitamin B12 transporter
MSRILFLASASALALITAATPARAQESDKVEKVVVTASRLGAVPENRLGTAVSVLERKQIEERQTRLVSDVLRDVPGVAVNRSGGVGGLTQVRMRGAEGNHTLILLDGADISDPFQGEFDFAGLLADSIARIEILRGSQSALYGSDAVGGVINIIPRRGEGDLAVEAFVEGGAFDTWQAAANLSAGSDTADIFLSANHYATNGTNNARVGTEEDGAHNTALFANAGARLAPNLELRGLLRYVDTYAEADPQDFFTGLVVDGADETESEQLYAQLSATLSLLDDRWLTRLGYALADVERANVASGTAGTSEGERHKVSLVSALTFDTGAANHKLTGAIDWKRESYSNVIPDFFVDAQGEVEGTGYVASYDLSLGRFDAGAAFRHDDNDRFQDADTYRLQASWRVTDTTRLRATMGTGIKNPTFQDLFGFDPNFFVGSPNLKAEKSEGWDVGIDQTLFEGKARATLTYFEATLEDEIFTDFSVFPFTAGNRTDESRRRGIELTFDAALGRAWDLHAAYTYVDAEEAGAEEVRRAPHIASLNLTHRFLDDRGAATLSVRYNGDQTDTHFFGFAPFSEVVTLKAFTLVNLNASWRVTDNIELFARGENLLDEDYEEVFSYATPGPAAYAGLRAWY